MSSDESEIMHTLTLILPDGAHLDRVEVGRAFHDELGVLVEVPDNRGGQALDAVLLVAAVGIKPFVDSLLAELGTSTGKALARVLPRLGRPVRLRDGRTGVEVVLDDAALSSESSLRQLTRLDLKEEPSGVVLFWDESTRRWKDEHRS